jgi:hypothetical protein
MALRIACQHCKRKLPFSRGMLGTRVQCSHCSKSFHVPDNFVPEGANPEPGAPPQANAAVGQPAPAAPAPAARTTPVLNRTQGDAYDLASEPEGPARPPVVEQHKPRTAASAQQTGADAYDLKEEPAKPAVAKEAPKAVAGHDVTAAAKGKGKAHGPGKSERRTTYDMKAEGAAGKTPKKFSLFGWLFRRPSKPD